MSDVIGICDTCDSEYDVTSRENRCGDCGDCGNCCVHTGCEGECCTSRRILIAESE